jgi:hypothetical protein
MTADDNGSEPTLTIIFGCLATVLALAGIIVACVQYRSYNRTSDSPSSPSSLEAGLPLNPVNTGSQPQEQGDSDSAPKANDVRGLSTPSDAGAERTRDGRGAVEIA